MRTPDTPSDTGSAAAPAPAQESGPPALPEEQELHDVDAREAHVVQLQKQYRERTYRVDASELSSKIVDKHLSK